MTHTNSRSSVRHPFALLAAIAALAIAGCGGDSDSENLSVADAKAKLSKDCQEGKASDKKLCDCIADELQKGGKSAKQIDDVRKDVNDGNENKDVTKAAATCGAKLAEELAGG